jgi:hypothetical protein
MIRCRVCNREHETDTKICTCGADLAVDGIAIGTDARFGDADLGDTLPDLGELPDLGGAFPGDSPLTDSLSIPDAEPMSPPSAPGESVPPVVESAPDPSPPSPPPGRDFAVQPKAASGEARRGESPTIEQTPDAPSALTPVPTAPVVEGDLESSVFAEDLLDENQGEWNGGVGLREGLRLERAGGVITCPTCGRDVAADRRFCRCGHQFDIQQRVPVEAEREPSALTSFWRRLSGTGKSRGSDARTWGQRAKDTGARRGMRYATRIGGRTRLGRMGMMFAGGAGLIMVFGPLRQQVRDLPDLFEATKPAQIDRWTPGPCDGPALEEAEVPWQTQWPGDEGASDESTCPGRFGTITGTFSQPVDIDRMTITIGRTSGQGNVNQGQPVMSPAEVVIEFAHDDTEPTVIDALSLKDTADQQEFKAKARDATGFTITITDVVDHDWPELELVQIGQIAFFRD